MNGICWPRKLWPAIDWKKLAIWVSIEMIPFGPMLLKFVDCVSELKRSVPPPRAVFTFTLTGGELKMSAFVVGVVSEQSVVKQR